MGWVRSMTTYHATIADEAERRLDGNLHGDVYARPQYLEPRARLIGGP